MLAWHDVLPLLVALVGIAGTLAGTRWQLHRQARQHQAWQAVLLEHQRSLLELQLSAAAAAERRQAARVLRTQHLDRLSAAYAAVLVAALTRAPDEPAAVLPQLRTALGLVMLEADSQAPQTPAGAVRTRLLALHQRLAAELAAAAALQRAPAASRTRSLAEEAHTRAQHETEEALSAVEQAMRRHLSRLRQPP